MMRDKATLILPEREALRLLGEYTCGRYDVYWLAGSIYAKLRANIASALMEKKVPVKDAGVTALRETFFKMAEVPHDCRAVQEQNFIDWAKG